jgi:phenylalanyl-tRNA synthetase beta chain
VGEALRRAGGDLLESVHLFDVYRGRGIDEGARSLAYRLRFCAPDRTLTDEEVGELRTSCIDAVTKQFGASLR